MADEIIDPYCLPDKPVTIQLDDILKARDNIKDGIVYTPCLHSHLDSLVGMEVYFKQDFLQFTGSFKERGARNTLLLLTDEQKVGVIACSAGNHASALSYHGKLLNIPVTVVMPVVAPIMKIEKCKKLGANVIVEGNNLAESKTYAMKMGKEKGLTYINGYDHPNILEGQGTCALEILEQVPDVDAIIVPTGGGGLLAGIATAVKGLKPTCEVYGVESVQAPGMSKAFEAGKPVVVPVLPTLADGLAVALVGVNSYASSKNTVKKMIVIKEDIISTAMLRLVELEKCVVEGAGATSLGAILSGQLDELKGKKVVCVLSGGNVDTPVLYRSLERGLACDGRFIKTNLLITDKPGALGELFQAVGKIGVNVKHMHQERAWVLCDVYTVRVLLMCETRDYDHALELRELLTSKYNAEFPDFPPRPRGMPEPGRKSCKCK